MSAEDEVALGAQEGGRCLPWEEAVGAAYLDEDVADAVMAVGKDTAADL